MYVFIVEPINVSRWIIKWLNGAILNYSSICNCSNFDVFQIHYVTTSSWIKQEKCSNFNWMSLSLSLPLPYGRHELDCTLVTGSKFQLKWATRFNGILKMMCKRARAKKPRRNRQKKTAKCNKEFVILIWFIKCLQSKYICMMKSTRFLWLVCIVRLIPIFRCKSKVQIFNESVPLFYSSCFTDYSLYPFPHTHIQMDQRSLFFFHFTWSWFGWISFSYFPLSPSLSVALWLSIRRFNALSDWIYNMFRNHCHLH